MLQTVVINGRLVEYDDLEFEVCRYVKGNYLHYTGNGDNITNPVGNTICYHMFAGCRHESLDLSRFDTSNVSNMRAMFKGCSSLTSLDVSGFDTSNVENMSFMFGECSSLVTLNLSSFDTSNVRDMSGMFYECKGLTSLDLSNFDTPKVRYVGGMFADCISLIYLDLSSFNPHVITCGMYPGCKNLSRLIARTARTNKQNC